MPATKKLHGLQFGHRWISHLGALTGCLDYLGRPLPTGWLFGGTGHAFLLVIHKEVCPSGPTVWEWSTLWRLAANLGVRIEGVSASKHDPEFAARQEQAWDMVRDAINRDVPCYGWELAIPEFACIHGYDETGYYFSGPGAGDDAGPKPWREAGDTGIGLLSLHTVELCDSAPVERQVREALQFALDASDVGEGWTPGYFVGLPGYEAWAKAVERGTAGRFGQGYNAACWAECRGEAVSFLRLAKQRLPGRADAAFDEAMGHYSSVHSHLKAVAALAPFYVPEGEGERYQSAEAARLLREAGAAEAKGVEALSRVAQSL